MYDHSVQDCAIPTCHNSFPQLCPVRYPCYTWSFFKLFFIWILEEMQGNLELIYSRVLNVLSLLLAAFPMAQLRMSNSIVSKDYGVLAWRLPCFCTLCSMCEKSCQIERQKKWKKQVVFLTFFCKTAVVTSLA